MIFFLLLLLLTTHCGKIEVEAPAVCDVLIPDFPLTAEGLMTPYRLLNCNQSNPDQSTFVQATIYDLDTGEMANYSPLMITFGQPVLEPPTPIVLPPNSIVGIWFGSNFDAIRLRNEIGIRNGLCVPGLNITVPSKETPSGFIQDVSPFGQFAHCNAPQFFEKAKASLPTQVFLKFDGTMCPTARDFLVIDADQSDNLHTTYLSLANDIVIQNTKRNRDKYQGLFTILRNPSDESLVTEFINPALGCDSPRLLDLTDEEEVLIGGLAINEMYASIFTDSRQALIPLGNPFVMVGNRTSLEKVNLYRLGVFQPEAQTQLDASTAEYCTNYVDNGLVKMNKYKANFLAFRSPNLEIADNLFFFLAFRFKNSYDVLGCEQLIYRKNPIKLTMEGDKVVDVEINIK